MKTETKKTKQQYISDLLDLCEVLIMEKEKTQGKVDLESRNQFIDLMEKVGG